MLDPGDEVALGPLRRAGRLDVGEVVDEPGEQRGDLAPCELCPETEMRSHPERQEPVCIRSGDVETHRLDEDILVAVRPGRFCEQVVEHPYLSAHHPNEG